MVVRDYENVGFSGPIIDDRDYGNRATLRREEPMEDPESKSHNDDIVEHVEA